MSTKDKKMISSMLMKISQGMSYTDVLEKLRKKMNPGATDSKVVSIRATQTGDVLILLDEGSNKVGFTTEVKRVVGDLDDV